MDILTGLVLFHQWKSLLRRNSLVARRRSTTRQQELMDISTLVKTLSVFFTACSWAGHDVLSLELSYPPNIVTDENVCLLDWTSSKAVCESKTQPATKHRLFRYDGKKVFFFNIRKWTVLCPLFILYILRKEFFKPYLSYQRIEHSRMKYVHVIVAKIIFCRDSRLPVTVCLLYRRGQYSIQLVM